MVQLNYELVKKIESKENRYFSSNTIFSEVRQEKVIF